MKKVFALFFILSSFVAYGQIDRSVYLKSSNNFIFDYFAQPCENHDSIRITVFYKVAYNALVFAQKENKYSTNFQIEVVFRDENGIIRRRATVNDTIFVVDYKETKNKKLYRYGFIEQILPKSFYKLNIQVLDLNSQVINKTNYEFVSKKANEFPFRPLFAYSSYEFQMVSIVQNGISFSSNKFSIYLPLENVKSNFVDYEIVKNEDKSETNWGAFKAISGSTNLKSNISLFFNIDKNGIRIFESENLNSKKYFILKDLDNSFVPGSYFLILKYDEKIDTLDFKVVWENMPQSLNNPDYMLKVMEYILTDDEIKQLKSYKSRVLPQKILEYWKSKDPTPNTPFNEAMNEYFSRVDYAAVNFQTFTQKDGALTDRGMVYILYGPPDEIRNLTQNNKLREIWTYKRLIKEFTFEQVANGVYRLVQIQE